MALRLSRVSSQKKTMNMQAEIQLQVLQTEEKTDPIFKLGLRYKYAGRSQLLPAPTKQHVRAGGRPNYCI
jgi:hypothetical protein